MSMRPLECDLGMHRADFVDFLAANLPAGSSKPATALSASSSNAT